MYTGDEMKKWNVIFALFLIPLMYQNCSSKVNFETINSSLNKDGLSDSADDPNINNTNNVEIPYDPPAGPVEIISAEEVVDAIVEDETTNNEDIPQDVGTPDLNIDEDFYKCENYVEVQPDTNIVIPERNSNGTCYYVRLLKQVPSHKSGDFGEAREETVISRNHDGSGNINPYILGQIELSLSSLGNRKVAISGALDDPNAVLKIDNYFLIQVSTTESAP